MPTVSRWFLIAVLAAAAAGAVWLGASETVRPLEVALPAPETAPAGSQVPRGVVGMSGCLATACHGAPAEKTLRGDLGSLTWMSSGACWVAADPHRGAFDLLTRPSAAAMMKRLGSDRHATDDARCLACHTNPVLAEAGDERVLALRREGVSCEGCHGNAGGWLREHTAWNARTDRAATGMTLLATVGDRAAACAGCHVGAPADESRGYPVRDMNHDMIAAGHPRLNFDFAEYLRRLPKHWREKAPANPAREWLVGRIVHAEAACRLLADRATANDEHRPWPEFAEFDCAACHHKFADPEDKAARRTGELRWQALWPVTELPEFGGRELTGLRNEKPSSAKLAGLAEQVAKNLKPHGETLAKMSDEEIERLCRGSFDRDRPLPSDIDAMGQMLYGLAAFERVWPRDGVLEAFDRAFERFQKPRRDREWRDGVRNSLDDLRRQLRR